MQNLHPSLMSPKVGYKVQRLRPYFSTNPPFKISLKNPISYLVEAGFKWVFEKWVFSKNPLLQNKKWDF